MIKIALALTTLVALSVNAGTQIQLRSQTIQTAGMISASVDPSSNQSEWMIQFKNHVTEKNKKALKQLGLKVFSYLPEDTLVVGGSARLIAALNLSEIQTILPFRSEYKISVDLGSLAKVTSDHVQTVLLSLFQNSDLDRVVSELKQKNILVQNAQGTAIVATLKRSQIAVAATISGVEHVQPFHVIEPLHYKFQESDIVRGFAAGDYSDINGSESGTRVMNFESAWTQNFLGQNQVVGMADTGLDSGNTQAIHQDFASAVKSGYAVGMFGKTWADPMGHGTHVAGSVLGRGTASAGRLKGGAYAAGMVAQGMWSPILNNLSVPSDLGKMFSQAYADGARVHTNSWGAAANFGAYEKMAATVDQVMFDKEDLLIIFAAGNSGVDKNRDGRIDPNSVGTPGTAKNALTVGASENVTTTGGIQKKIGELGSAKDNWPVPPITLSTISDHQDGIAMFSSRGPTADGRIKPDVVAPGTNILSVKSQQPGANVLWGEYNPNYVWSGGTSMSAPLVAGAATIARQVLMAKLVPNPSAALVKAYVLQTATEMFPGQYGQGGASQGQEILTLRPNNDEGYGRVNVAQIMGTEAVIFMADNRTGVATGETFSKTVTASKAGRLVVNLVWTDAPGSLNAAKALVNDLDMSVVLPNKTLSSNDQINNHVFAQSDIEAGAAVTINVTGVNVPMGKSGKQPFAVVVSIQ